MPRKVRLRLLLLGLAKLIAVIVLAGVAGVGLGIGLSELTGDSQHDTSTGATHPATNKRQPRTSAVPVQVASVVLHRESGTSARRRRRAVLAVHVRVVNRGGRTIANLAPALVAGARGSVGPSAKDSKGSLLRPVRPGSTADGTLRFKTAGALTDRLTKRRRAQLRIAGKTVTLKVLIGSPARSAKRRR